MKERNVSIDILKCLAAILITTSHMQMLYPKFTFLATGGAVGDVLFFFCSGFTLFLKPMNGLCEFPNWYKHRINRIYPTVFAIAIITCSLFNSHPDINRIILHGGGWFVSCIMLYYVGIYFIGSYMKNKASLFGILVLIVSAIWFYSVYRTPEFLNIYNDTVHPIRWLMFFVFMLLGAKLGGLKNTQKSRPIMDCILLIICLVGFYSIYILTMHIDSIKGFQFFSVFPLLGVVYYFYRVFTSDWANKIYNSKIGYVLAQEGLPVFSQIS